MYKKIKYPLGRIIALCSFIILTPLLLIVSIVILIDDGRPILFRQKRVGENNNPFTIYKFRSMKLDAPSNIATDKISNTKSMLTRTGGFLRKSSLDELPQLINVIKGEMALIGPRPSLYNQYELNELRKKNGSIKLRPGITGLAQVSGRDELPIEIKADFDGEYYRKIGLLNDIKIIFLTISSVFKSENVVDR